MIESYYWKEELLKTATHIEKRLRVKRWTERQLCLFEREVMIAMFSVRVMLDRGRVTDALNKKTFRVVAHPRRPMNRKPSLMDYYNFDFPELYDMEVEQVADLTIMQLCNQLVHCHILFSYAWQKKWDTIYVCSDYEKDKRLFVLPVKMIVEILRLVGKCYPNSHTSFFDAAKGKWIHTSEMVDPSQLHASR